jgi:hypothetical protein
MIRLTSIALTKGALAQRQAASDAGQKCPCRCCSTRQGQMRLLDASETSPLILSDIG